jgi:circadian clock protein KaiC
MEQGVDERASTGVQGMDKILGGGMLRGRLYVLRGVPGVGKTTFGLQFLLQGARHGEPLLYFSFSQSKSSLLDIARSHRWSLDRIALRTADDNPDQREGQTIFPSAEVELMEQLRQLHEALADAAPARAVLDAGTALYAAYSDASVLQQGMQVLKARLAAKGCTALLLDDRDATPSDAPLEELADGVIAMTQHSASFGGIRRRLRIVKVQGAVFDEGSHDYRINTGGLTVFPRLIAARYRREHPHETVSCGPAALDELLGGGLDRGSCVLLLGPSGTGKSSVAMHVAAAAAERGEAVSIYLFDEGVHSFLRRADGLGMTLRAQVAAGRIRLSPLDPGECTAGEFAHLVRRSVESDGVRVVVIDTLHGYRDAMLEEEPYVVQHLRELLSYLREQAVVTVLVASHMSSFSPSTGGDIHLGSVEDAVLLFRHYEHAGEVRTSVSALKHRTSGHPRTQCDLRFGPSGVALGPMPVGEGAAFR